MQLHNIPNKSLQLTSNTPLRSCVMKNVVRHPCCTKDESRSLGFGDQKLESNCPMRLLLKAMVVSDLGKGRLERSGEYYGDERK